MKTATLAAATLAVIAVVTFNRFNRQLETACALPVYDERQYPPISAPRQVHFKRIPLALELIYVAIGMSASVGRTIRKALA